MAESIVEARSGLLRHAIRLEILTIVWNVLEATTAITGGVLAKNVAPIGFGWD